MSVYKILLALIRILQFVPDQNMIAKSISQIVTKLLKLKQVQFENSSKIRINELNQKIDHYNLETSFQIRMMKNQLEYKSELHINAFKLNQKLNQNQFNQFNRTFTEAQNKMIELQNEMTATLKKMAKLQHEMTETQKKMNETKIKMTELQKTMDDDKNNFQNKLDASNNQIMKRIELAQIEMKKKNQEARNDYSQFTKRMEKEQMVLLTEQKRKSKTPGHQSQMSAEQANQSIQKILGLIDRQIDQQKNSYSYLNVHFYQVRVKSQEEEDDIPENA